MFRIAAAHLSRARALRVALATLAPVLVVTSMAGAQAPATVATARTGRSPVPIADWAKWETLGAGTLSPDGKWIAYEVRRVNGGATELHYRALAADADRTVRTANGAQFTANTHFLLYTLVPDTAGGRGGAAGGGGRGGRGGGAPAGAAGAGAPRNKVGIVDLRTGNTTVFDDVQSFTLNKTGSHVGLRRYAAAGRRSADLVVRDLEQGSDVTLGNVAEFSWSDDGVLLAMTIDVEGKTGNGVQIMNPASGTIRSVDASDAQYLNLQWRARSTDLTVFRSRADSMFIDTAYTVLAWRGAGSATTARLAYDFASDTRFPAGMRVASYRRPQWSDDGGTLFFGIAPREPKPAPAGRGTGPAAARVEIWHWKDAREYHQQDRQAAQDRTKTHLVAWHLQPGTLVRLADDVLETVQLSDDRSAGIASDDTPYAVQALSGRSWRDVYRVDIGTGKRDKVITKTPFVPFVSPDGRTLLFTQGGHVSALDVATGKSTNLTSGIKSVFVDMEDDHPVHERRPYGTAGFTSGGRSVWLYDRFDLWSVNLDGTNATRLTRGREDSTVYRLVREGAGGRGGGRGGFGGAAADAPDPADRWIDPAKPAILSATGEFSKKSGYARLLAGQLPQRMLWTDHAVSQLQKAKVADVYVYERQSYEESPNYFVSGASLADGKRVSNTNAFQADYAWGKQALMPYRNKRGDKLQMMLTYPADYQPGKKYPMVVYYYEKLSQGFHQYINPSDRSTYNTTNFSQNGYFVLRPDVVFQARNPGWSGLDCVTSAVKAAIAAVPAIDAKRVGNMGHSWGGYQSAFYAVHNNGTFAATIAGAPLTDLVSFYGYTSFNSGLAETGHFETGQERMEVSLWEDPQAYLRNSTVLAMDSLKTPLLLEEGDGDGNVNYWQSHELYNAGRRLGKNVVYLIYNDENHGVARPESQADYTKRQLEWFGHYLKGEPAPDWIENGESYLTRQKLLKGSAPAAVVP